MNICVIYSGFSWASKEICEAMEKGFSRLGHNVFHFDPLEEKKIYSHLKDFLNSKDFFVNPNFLNELSFERLPSLLIEKECDFAFFVHGVFVPKRIVSTVRKAGIKTGVWLIDDPHEIDLSLSYSGIYDIIFTDERNAVEAHSKSKKPAFYLPVGFDSDIYFPCVENDEKYKSDICVLASGFSERIRLLESIYPVLKKYDFKLIGNWDNLSLSSPLRKHVKSGLVSVHEAARYYRGAKIVINPHRNPWGASLGSNFKKIPAVSPNPRVFESAACAAFCLTDDYRKDCFEFFKKDEEIGSFSSPEDLSEKIEYWLKEDKKRKEAARRAAVSALKHSYIERAKTVLECLDGVYEAV